ncbi:hypothetical protein DDB_G0286989 [Pseudomonas phage phiPto-bp6g]|nr:hypothetical protein DDB_G0286989 [Pseudomonas phage phiPto-bp6g]
MNIEYCDKYTPEICRLNPHKVYIYGDNLAGYGTAGQACIRKEPNAFGIPTKRYPSTHEGSYFRDSPCEMEHVKKSLRQLYSLARRHTIVFPSKGIGTGLAKMPTKSPLIFKEMCEILMTHMNIRNGR